MRALEDLPDDIKRTFLPNEYEENWLNIRIMHTEYWVVVSTMNNLISNKICGFILPTNSKKIPLHIVQVEVQNQYNEIR